MSWSMIETCMKSTERNQGQKYDAKQESNKETKIFERAESITLPSL